MERGGRYNRVGLLPLSSITKDRKEMDRYNKVGLLPLSSITKEKKGVDSTIKTPQRVGWTETLNGRKWTGTTECVDSKSEL